VTTVSVNGRGSRGHGQIIVSLLLGVVALMTCLWSYAAPAHALPAPQAASCAGVWVVVDYGALGGTETACAGSGYSTGMAALRSAGFTPTLDSGLVVKIKGLPTTPNIQENYWSYWHASRQADGSYSGWAYSSLGPSSYHPVAGGAEGWRYEPVGGGYVAPGAVPPKQTVTTQAPATTAPATTARTTTAATRGATTAAAGQTTSQTAATTAPDSPTASTSESQPTAPISTPVTMDSRVEGATLAPAAPTNSPTSSLFGGVIAILAIAAAAGGMLLWRKRLAAKG
jgi:hypothetical protein